MKKVYESIKGIIAEKHSREDLEKEAQRLSKVHNVPYDVVRHVINKETGGTWATDKVNRDSGATGIMQILPKYATNTPAGYEVDKKDLLDPYKSMHAGIKKLGQWYNTHRNKKLPSEELDVNAAKKAMASYNAGPNGDVVKDKKGNLVYRGAATYIRTGNPKHLPKETQNYIADFGGDNKISSNQSSKQVKREASSITPQMDPDSRKIVTPVVKVEPKVQDKPAPEAPKNVEVKPQVTTNTENPYTPGTRDYAFKQARIDGKKEFTDPVTGQRIAVKLKENNMKNIYSVIGNIVSEANTQRQNDKAGDSISREIEAQNAKLAQMQKMSSQSLPPGYRIQSRPASGPDKKPEWGANLVRLFKGEPVLRVSRTGPGYEEEKPANYARLQGKDGDLKQTSAKISDVSTMNLGDPYQPVSSKQAVRSVQTVKTANTSSNINATLSGLDHKALKSVVPSANAMSSTDVAKAAAILTSKAVSGKSESQPSAAASREIKAAAVPQSNATVQVSPAPRANTVVVQQRSANVVSANNAPVQRSSTNTRRELTPFEKEFARARANKETEFTWHDEKGRPYKVGTKLKGETNPPEVRTSGTRRRSSNIVRSNTSTNVKSEAPSVSKSDSVIVPDEEMKDIDAQIKRQAQPVAASDNGTSIVTKDIDTEKTGTDSELKAADQEDKPAEEQKKRKVDYSKGLLDQDKSNKTNEETQMSINKKFNVSDSLYTAVMEVMKKPSPGSTPRNEKEKKLASMHGDPDVITHGDILKARGVKMKEEVEGVDESLTKKILDAADAVGSAFGIRTDPLSDERKKEEASKNQASKIEPNKKAEQPKKPVKEDWVDSKGKFHKEAPPPGQVPSPDEGYRPPKAQPKTPGKKTQPGSTTKAMNDVEEEVVQEMSSKQKMKLGLYNKKKSSVKENTDTPGNSYEHQCAIHVKSESFGEGRTITTQHADPDELGNIAWYDVMFEHGIEKYVPTNELEILVSESHMHSKRKKKGM